MPPRRRTGETTTSNPLTPENLEALAAALAAGKRATVYLREAVPGLGLPAGTSAKVISVQGNTVMISPKGVNDELPYEAEELQMTRPSAPKAAAPKPAASKTQPATSDVPAVHQGIEPGPPPAPKAPSRAPKAAVAPVTSDAPKAAPARRTPSKKTPAGVSVTIHAGADNDWSVTVAHGAKRPGKAVPVTPDSVERAVRELGEATAIEAVENIIVAARDKAATRVNELSQQLEEARKLLEALGDAE